MTNNSWQSDINTVITVTIEDGISSIGSEAFKNGNNMASVTVPNSVTTIGESAFDGCASLTSIVIPQSVTSIGNSSFNNCSALSRVFYLGASDPIELSSENVFNGCDQLKFVCVPSIYDSSSFCGLTKFCKHKSCESFLHNRCYEPVCNDDIISMEKRENATFWERKTTECYEFQCNNESGPVYWKQCNKSGEVCENDVCVVKKEEKKYSVIIEVINGIHLTDFKMTEIRSVISNLTNIDADKINIRINTNEKDEIIEIIVIVNDETTAEHIKDNINDAIKEHNKEGILRYVESARVVVNEKVLSISSGIMKTEDKTVVLIAIAFMLLLIHTSEGR